jgi:osmotically inducible lipoprotein OsmB
MGKIGIVALMGLTLAACSPRQERLAVGAGLGGATGAVVGGLATGTAGGAVAGAAIGAVGGAAIAHATRPRARCWYNRDGYQVCRR